MAGARQAGLQEIETQVRTCEQCRLQLSRRVAVPGEGPLDAELLLLGEGPGVEEDAIGRPFVGASGRFLRRALQEVGLRPEALFITNVVKCRPPGNRAPRADEMATCTSLYLTRQVEFARPLAIVSFGATAAGAVLADAVKMTRDHGQWRRDYDLTAEDLPVFITYHPAAALRSERWRQELRGDLERLAASRRKWERVKR